jgi:hypothetical protein
MKGIRQTALIISLGMASASVADEPKAFQWDAPKIAQSMFTPALGMLDSERDEYATNLAQCAANRVEAQKAAPAALAEARRMLALAQHLSPRNKKVLVSGFQLSKGVIPEVTQEGYSPQAFARLLHMRGQMLEKQGGAENEKLARMFIQLAATMDPRNEDAVYASEVHRLDHGEIDWPSVIDPAGKPPSTPQGNGNPE